MSYRIAIASSNGEAVDRHFGQARNFLVYEISDAGVEFVEDREIRLVSGEAAHTERNMNIFADALSDCSAVFVQRIGATSARFLHERNIRPFEVSFTINHIVTTLLKQRDAGRVRVFRR
jgi:nitrogen fixation protein NifX